MKATEAKCLAFLKKAPQFVIPIYQRTYSWREKECRKQVLALDPCVGEEFRKHYIAYKAETNFVDVVPQVKRLRLSLNLAFPEITDPRGMCKDISQVGRWGNGDVEVMLGSREELPYVMGLVRQSLERQLGNGGDA